MTEKESDRDHATVTGKRTASNGAKIMSAEEEAFRDRGKITTRDRGDKITRTTAQSRNRYSATEVMHGREGGHSEDPRDHPPRPTSRRPSVNLQEARRRPAKGRSTPPPRNQTAPEDPPTVRGRELLVPALFLSRIMPPRGMGALLARWTRPEGGVRRILGPTSTGTGLTSALWSSRIVGDGKERTQRGRRKAGRRLSAVDGTPLLKTGGRWIPAMRVAIFTT